MAVQVLTQHNNNQRTRVNRAETTLTVEAVRLRCRKLFEIQVDPPAQGGPSNWTSQIVAHVLATWDIRS